MPEELPMISQKAPYKVDLEAGKKYFWCSCGKSATQPFCDGAHKGSGMKSVMFEAAETKTHYICGCKHAKDGSPFCDGEHNKL